VRAVPSLILSNPLGVDDAQRIGLDTRDYAVGEIITVNDFVFTTLVRTGYGLPYGSTTDVLLIGDGSPTELDGEDGQWYLDELNEVLWGPKQGGLWPSNPIRPDRGVQQLRIDGDQLRITYSNGTSTLAGRVRMVSRGAWAAGAVYAVDDLVTSDAALFRVTAAHTAAAPAPSRTAPGAAYELLAHTPDATGTVKGAVRLAGDLGGTADAPTVPGLVTVSESDRAYVRSFAATDLIANGSGYLRDNTNFSAFGFDPADSPVGGGCFIPPQDNATRTNDELIPVDLTRRYTVRAAVRQKGTPAEAARFYLGLACYDVDGLAVTAQHYMFQTGTTTTLAADLKPGDTVMYLTSAANWNNAAGTSTHLRSVIVWGYTDRNGKVWPAETYSRWRSTHDIYADGAVDTVANTVTLRVGFEPQNWGFAKGQTIPAGTPLSNGSAGGAYMYCTASNAIVPDQWTTFESGQVGGQHPSGPVAATTAFPAGTAFVRLLLLPNRASNGSYLAGSRMALAAVSMSDVGWALKDLASASVGNAAGQLVRRNASGAFDAQRIGIISAPVANSDATRKDYVDAQDAAFRREPRTILAAGVASYTLALGDEGDLVGFTSGDTDAKTIVVPANATVPFPIGGWVDLYRSGTHTVTISPAAGVTVLAPDGNLTIRAQNSTVRLLKVSTDGWLLLGDNNDAVAQAVAAATPSATANTLARRASDGGVSFAAVSSSVAPSLGAHLTRKDYVDGLFNQAGRNRGSGTALPATDLRRGDVYGHNTQGLHVYTGSRWVAIDAYSDTMEGVGVYAYGHSYLASDFYGQSEEQRYILRAAQRLDFPVVNRAVGGYKMQDAELDAVGNRSGWRKWTPNTKGVVVVDCTINDVNGNGATTAALAGYRNALRSMCEFLSLREVIDSEAAGWTYSGFAATNFIDFYGGSYRKGADPSSASRSFDGTEVTVGLVGVSFTEGEAEILVDGVLKETVPLSAQCVPTKFYAATGADSRDFVHVTRRITGLAAGSHTLLVRTKAGVAGNVWLDWVGFRATNPPKIALVKCVDVADTTKDAAIDQYNAIIDQVAAEFPNVVVCDPTVGWDRAVHVGPDGVHLSARGNAHIAATLTHTLASIDHSDGATNGGKHYQLPGMSDAILEVVEVAAGDFAVGHQKWGAQDYEHLSFYLHRDGFVTVTGVWQYNNATGATGKVMTVGGAYRPRGGRRQILPGSFADGYRQFDVTSDALNLRGAVPTTTGFMNVHGTYPGWYATPQ
jgi:hypothetical protein